MKGNWAWRWSERMIYFKWKHVVVVVVAVFVDARSATPILYVFPPTCVIAAVLMPKSRRIFALCYWAFEQTSFGASRSCCWCCSSHPVTIPVTYMKITAAMIYRRIILLNAIYLRRITLIIAYTHHCFLTANDKGKQRQNWRGLSHLYNFMCQYYLTANKARKQSAQHHVSEADNCTFDNAEYLLIIIIVFVKTKFLPAR